MSSEIAKLNDVAQGALYKLRLNKLDKTSRILQKNGIIDNNGFLTLHLHVIQDLIGRHQE